MGEDAPHRTKNIVQCFNGLVNDNFPMLPLTALVGPVYCSHDYNDEDRESLNNMPSLCYNELASTR